MYLVAVPRVRVAMAGGVGRTHMRYSRWINQDRGWTGHLWANRFHSSLLEHDHLWNAVRYVELNRVRAGLVSRPEDWPWSSAVAHCSNGNVRDQLLSPTRPFPGSIADWSTWLREGVSEEFCDLIRKNTATGRPTGSLNFVRRVEALLSREIAPARKRGRPRKPLPDPDPAADLFS